MLHFNSSSDKNKKPLVFIHGIGSTSETFKNQIKHFKKNNYVVSIDLSELKSNLVIKLAKYKIPKKIFYVEDIPKNTLGKIDYKILKAYYIKLINEVKTKEKK